MKLILLIVLSLVLFTGTSKDIGNFTRSAPIIDTIPPPPPPQNIPLTGPSAACVGETSTYYTEVPLSCECEWRINGILLPDTTPLIHVTWAQAGQQILTLLFVCEGGTTAPEAIVVEVEAEPGVYLGPDTTIMQGESITLDAGNPGSSYLWSTGATTQTIAVSTTGTYSVTVTNDCGSEWDEIYVSVYIGIGENANFDGKAFYDGQFIRIEKGTEEISEIRLMDSRGRICYEGSFLPSLKPANKGLYLLSIKKKEGYYTRKILIH